ncbi:MAG: MBL fold metallo-hydrolase [Oscillospiraceae bacterium]|nr:MBL fold metallo-hydrolase [Oscillospiraceae bacterium]
MEITCIGHSGFLVGLPQYNLIFDYFTDENNIITPEIFKNKSTCVFVSHEHPDHYNKKIFDWRSWGKITYVLDRGCTVPHNLNNAEIIMVREGDDFYIFGGAVKIKIYSSTDEGVSFLVTTGNSVIFHAGDLNDWYWEAESTPEELIEYEENYLSIIRKLAGQKIDVAFIPEDPRLGRNAARGIQYFREIVAPDRIIPMHFPGNDGIKY